MYIHEAHTSDVWQDPDNLDDKVVFASPKNFDERSQMGQLCLAKLGIKFPAVIDTFDNATERAYTGWPDPLYVIDQALDVRELLNVLQNGDAFFEGNPFMGRVLQTHPSLADVNRLSIFLSPLSSEEITYLKAPERHISVEEFVIDVVRRKLLRRVRRQKGELSVRDLENVETRASSAFRELQEAWHFQYVIPNHDGEDSDHWEAFYFLIGDARKTLGAFVDLLKGSVPPGVEQWNEKLLSQET